jgi:hypothetical protein
MIDTTILMLPKSLRTIDKITIGNLFLSTDASEINNIHQEATKKLLENNNSDDLL